MAEIFENLIARLSARKSEQMKKFLWDKNMPISTVRLTMLCLSGFELYCCWVPLMVSRYAHAHNGYSALIFSTD